VSGEPAVVAVVAAFNEEETIGATVKELAALPSVRRVVVAADGCTDATVLEAVGAGAVVVASGRRRGKGAALEAGLRLVWPDVTSGGAAAVLLADGDLGATAGGLASLLDPVLEGRLDLVVGILPAQPGGGFGAVRRMASWGIAALSGFRAQAPLSGQRAVAPACLDACRPLARGFGVETAMTIDAARLGFRVGEVPVSVTHRSTGRSIGGFAHRGRQGLDIGRALAVRAARLR
jgi:glycosyl transferase family 2